MFISRNDISVKINYRFNDKGDSDKNHDLISKINSNLILFLIEYLV